MGEDADVKLTISPKRNSKKIEEIEDDNSPYAIYLNRNIVVIVNTDKGQQMYRGLCTGINETHLFLNDEVSKSPVTINLEKIDIAKFQKDEVLKNGE